jgi:hypothetical protein
MIIRLGGNCNNTFLGKRLEYHSREQKRLEYYSDSKKIRIPLLTLHFRFFFLSPTFKDILYVFPS